jgi:hypothetical protein
MGLRNFESFQTPMSITKLYCASFFNVRSVQHLLLFYDYSLKFNFIFFLLQPKKYLHTKSLKMQGH